MSQRNVEIVRQAFGTWARGDMEAHLRLFDEHVVCQRMVPLIDSKVYRGVEGYLAWADEWLRLYEDFRFHPSEYTDAGERVLVEVPQEGRLTGSDQVMTGVFWFLLTLRDGKVIRFEIYGERGRAREAAGLTHREADTGTT
jgi:ketosteroid isomerase-like protein